MYKYLFILISLLSFSAQANAQLIHDFKVNDDTAGNVFRYHANISTNKNGLSAIVWEEYVLGNIYAQIYDKNFSKINNNFKVNIGIDTSVSPDIVVTNHDKIGIVWSKPGAFLGRLFFKIFNKYGLPLTSAIQIIDTTNGYFSHSRIGCDSLGRFIIVWDNATMDIYYQILDSSGNKIGNNTKVNEENTGWGAPDIVVRKDGSFIIAWSDHRGIGGNIYMQIYDKNGTPIGINKMVNDTIGANDYCGGSKIVQDSSGNFIIAFNVYILNNNWNYIKYQRYDKNGFKLGQNKDLPPVPAQMYMNSFDSDEEGNLVFQMNMSSAASYYIYNVRVDKNNNLIGQYFPASNEYIYTEKYGEDIKIHNKKIVNVWNDIRLSTQPQIYANVRSFINPDSTVGIINISNEIPEKFKLHQNYPNPFNPNTSIKFHIKEKSFVTLKIFDLLGRETETLVNEIKHAGTYEAAFDASHLPSGVYFYNFFIDGIMLDSKKMVLLK